MVKDLTPTAFVAERARSAHLVLLDVREDWETRVAAVPMAHVHIPMGQIPQRLAELDPQSEIAVICRSGGRSLEVARFLERHGFASVYNVAGGILAWSRELDPRIPQY